MALDSAIKKGETALRSTRLSCPSFGSNAVRLRLCALADNLGNLLPTLSLPSKVAP